MNAQDRAQGSKRINDALTVKVSEMLTPWAAQLGEDRVGYTNHVVRVLLLADELHAAGGGVGAPPSEQPQFLTAGVFHDLGIWSDQTFDYLVPSIDLARDHLDAAGQSELFPLVEEMIDLHHKVRAAGDPLSDVEVFRRADTIDVLIGLRRFGLPLARVRAIRRDYPDRGFHKMLVRQSARRLIEHPASPLPMFKW